MSIESLKLKKFTAFENICVNFSPGINVFIGENSTGKTHILKVLYSACDITNTQRPFRDKLLAVFMPKDATLGRLAKRRVGRTKASVEITVSDKTVLNFVFSNLSGAKTRISPEWLASPIATAYIPVKDMLANALGFPALYRQRQIHFEEIYADIIDKASIPPLRGAHDSTRRKLTKILHDAIEGNVYLDGGEFFHQSKSGNLEFSLLAEGHRKLGLLWLLIQNGTLTNGSILFWDEPEANINPRLIKTLVKILLELQQAGVQIFIATHNYFILKELDLQKNKDSQILFHALYRTVDSEISCNSTSDYLQISPNAIDSTFSDMYDRELQKSLGSMK